MKIISYRLRSMLAACVVFSCGCHARRPDDNQYMSECKSRLKTCAYLVNHYLEIGYDIDDKDIVYISDKLEEANMFRHEGVTTQIFKNDRNGTYVKIAAITKDGKCAGKIILDNSNKSKHRKLPYLSFVYDKHLNKFTYIIHDN